MESKIWKIDTTHSNIGFKIKHMMFTNVKGNFNSYSASVEMPESNFEKAKLTFEADASSINTNNADRDNHLKSADFFDAEQFPTVKFESTNISKKSDNGYAVTGNLTMHGVTQPVTLNAEYSGLMKDPWGNTKLALSLEGKVNRKEWGLNWNSALESGGVLVSENVNFDIETQFS
jgi:polyisoprenoid-binding protein YceI